MTNPWLADFPKTGSVRAALLCLAGIYIYDYQRTELLKQRTRELFEEANQQFGKLLSEYQASPRLDEPVEELITLCCVLSVLAKTVERSGTDGSVEPLWLQGFRLAGDLLDTSDTGIEFWEPEGDPIRPLRTSQAVVAGFGVVLSQPMMELPESKTFDFEKDLGRLSWLMRRDSEGDLLKQIHEIHGACGLSRRLILFFDQITCLAANLKQKSSDQSVLEISISLFDMLGQLRQWSREWKWDERSDVLGCIDEGRPVQTAEMMTKIVAESWRITAMLYLQCRLFRLPRNDKNVRGNIERLATCVGVMPTKGSVLTTIAPLLPVFLLGVLSTEEKDQIKAQSWLDRVKRAKSRSVSFLARRSLLFIF
jgi:hypothetical protein